MELKRHNKYNAIYNGGVLFRFTVIRKNKKNSYAILIEDEYDTIKLHFDENGYYILVKKYWISEPIRLNVIIFDNDDLEIYNLKKDFSENSNKLDDIKIVESDIINQINKLKEELDKMQSKKNELLKLNTDINNKLSTYDLNKIELITKYLEEENNEEW